MNMKHLGWKVLRTTGEHPRTSTFATTGALEYPVGQRVVPLDGCGPLTLFSSFEDAQHFSKIVGGGSSNPAVIIPVKYEPWLPTSEDSASYSLWQPKKGPSARGEKLFTYASPADTISRGRVETAVRRWGDLPQGTVLAAAITCLE